MDPISLLLMAQSAVSAIKSGCDLLAQGKAQVTELKEQIGKGVGDAKAIYKEVTGLWGWLKSLFSDAPDNKEQKSEQVAKAVEQPAPVKQKSAAQRQKELEAMSYEEYQAKAVHDVCENLKVYFEAIRQLKAHCRELEEQSLNTEKVAESAIDRIELEWQMKQLSTQVREAMTYTPESLGLQALYSRFLEMYDQILEEQEFARAVKAKKERDAKWQRELLKHHRIDRALTGVAVLVLILWMWGFLLSLGWLEKTPAGSLLRLLFSV